MDWYLPAGLAIIGWGVGQVIMKKAISLGVSSVINNFFLILVTAIFFIPYALHLGISGTSFPAILFYALIPALLNMVVPYVLAAGDISLTGTLLASYPIYTVILSTLFLHESLPPIKIAGIVLIIAAMYLVAKPTGFKIRLEKWFLIGIFGAICLGVADYVSKVILIKYDFSSYIFSFSLCFLPAFMLTVILDKNRIPPSIGKKAYFLSFLGSILMTFGLYNFFQALSLGPASLVSPVTSTYPAIIVLLAYLFLKEKFTLIQFIGIIIALTGIVITGM